MALAMIIVGAVIAASCGAIEEPYLGADVTVVSTEPSQRVAETEVQTGAAQSVSAPSPALPTRDPDYVATVMLSTSSGVSNGSVDGLSRLEAPLGETPVRLTVDDLFGGVVVDSPELGVAWYSGEGAEPVTIRDSTYRLLDVSYLANTVEALVLSSGRDVERVRLVDGETQRLTTVDEGLTLLDFSAAGGLYALALADSHCGRVEFINSVGEPVGVGGPPAGECTSPQRARITLLDFSPIGDVLAYAEVSYRSDGVESSTELVGMELSNSAEVFRIRIGDVGDDIASLSFDGRRVAVVRTSLDGAERQVMIVDALAVDPIPSVLPADIDSSARISFARLPLKLGPADTPTS